MKKALEGGSGREIIAEYSGHFSKVKKGRVFVRQEVHYTLTDKRGLLAEHFGQSVKEDTLTDLPREKRIVAKRFQSPEN